jgi:hypothetical protein
MQVFYIYQKIFYNLTPTSLNVLYTSNLSIVEAQNQEIYVSHFFSINLKEYQNHVHKFMSMMDLWL